MVALAALLLVQPGFQSPLAEIGSTPQLAMSDDGKVIVARIQESITKPHQIICKDLNSGEIVYVSSLDGKIANGSCLDFSVSPDGGTVVFKSTASNLGVSNPNCLEHLYAWDRATKKVRCLTEQCNPDILARHPFGFTVANGGSRVMFQTLPYNNQIPSRLWIVDGDKVKAFSEAAGCSGEQIEDHRGALAADGTTFYAVVGGKSYNEGKPIGNPFLIIGSLDKGISYRVPMPNKVKVGQFCLASNGSAYAFNDCQQVNGQYVISIYASMGVGIAQKVRQFTARPKSHYPYALAMSGDGSTIVYQASGPNAKGEDSVYSGRWIFNEWQQVSIDRYGKSNEYMCGMDGSSMRGFVSSRNGSKVAFIGRFFDINRPASPSPKVYIRDLENRQTTLIP